VASALQTAMDLVDIFLHFKKLCKQLVKNLLTFWTQQVEDVRCLSFAVLHKIARLDNEMFPIVYKGCYHSFISNTKLIDQETLPLIAFMRKSFAELTLLKPDISRQYAFVYIRQLGIHMRTAILAKHKDLMKTVYNWQFIQGLYLWTDVLCECCKESIPARASFMELCQPLVEIIGILRKIYVSKKHLPLKIHCVKMQLKIQTALEVFVPTLASSIELLDDLNEIDKNKPQFGKGVTKAKELRELISLKNAQMDDAGYRHMLGVEIYEVCREASNLLKSHAAFPNVMVPIDERLKRFIKSCPNQDHTQLFKSLRSELVNKTTTQEKTANGSATSRANKTARRCEESDDDEAMEE